MGAAVPTPTFVPLLYISEVAIQSVPLYLNVCPSVPEGRPLPPEGQLVRQSAPMQRPVPLTLPATSSFSVGVSVPTPTFVPLSKISELPSVDAAVHFDT